MKKKTQRIIIILLVILMLGSTFGYAISSIVTTPKNNENVQTTEEATKTLSYAQKLQEVLNKAVKDKNFIKQDTLDDLIKRNEASDYSLATTLNILGTPVCVLESYDNNSVNVYSNKKEITSMLNKISTNKNYTDNSFIQLYWMKDTGEAIITWIALGEEDMSEIKTIGIITSQYQTLDNLNLQTTNYKVEDFQDLKLDKDTIVKDYNPLLYKEQNKLLECKFTTNLMTNEEYKYNWNEYVLKNEDGYLFLNTKDDNLYLVYEQYSDNKIVPYYDKETISKIKDGMTIEEFLKIVPNAKLYEEYLYQDITKYSSYVVREKEDDTTLTYFDFKEGILSLDNKDSNKESNKNSNKESSIESVTEQATETLETTESN